MCIIKKKREDKDTSISSQNRPLSQLMTINLGDFRLSLKIHESERCFEVVYNLINSFICSFSMFGD